MPTDNYDVSQLRDQARLVAAEAARLVAGLRAAGPGEVSTKSTETDVVTSGDRAAERLVRERLAQWWPDAPVLGEEEGGETPSAGLAWVVDPIDGTVNYLYGHPAYAVSVAAQVDGESVAGAIVEPATGRTWLAARGAGATLDGRPLRVSAADRLELTLVATGFAYDRDRRARQGQLWAGLLPTVRDIRRGGAASLELCAVAAGWVDAYVEHGLHRWDWAAGALIAQEAGAVVRLPTDPGQSRADDGLGAEAVFVSTPGVAEQLRAALAGAGAGTV
ncbi:MAG TPA: inositol monophosphatase family protein [Pseudonocardiaceae bacterium]|nr:inositol monophosphatase family protein [Pseudonocardiaceae bacterium]